MAEPHFPFSRLYPIVDAAIASYEELAEDVGALARAGCRLVQFRAKELSGRELHDWALRGVAVAREAGTKLVVNDRADVAFLTEADGVHLGQDDITPGAARRLLGDEAIIGLSTHDLDQAKAASAEPVDYVAIGPVFATRSKRDHERPLGIEGVRAVRAVVEKPLVAIGGITLETAPALLEAGVDGLAVISALGKGGDLEATARAWMALRSES